MLQVIYCNKFNFQLDSTCLKGGKEFRIFDDVVPNGWRLILKDLLMKIFQKIGIRLCPQNAFAVRDESASP